jgi:hypothetical protein
MSSLSSLTGQAAPEERLGANPGILMLVLWLAATAALALPAITGGIFDALSTDDAMRLVEVRDLIGGQGWFDLVQHRLDPPGASMHWSRVIDAPLAALILLLRPLVGMHAAEALTLVVWPVALFAAVLALVAAIAGLLSNRASSSEVAALLLAVLSAPALIHFRPGAIDHHNVQIALVLALILLVSEIERSTVKAAMAGTAASLSLAIGIEMLPAILPIGVTVFALFIWRGASVSQQIGAFGAALAASSLALAAALVPLPSLALPVCDAFGGPVLLLLAGGGISLVIMVEIDRYHSSLRLRLATGAGLATALLAAFLSLFAGCIASPYSQLDPLVTSLWVDRVAESISLGTILQLAPQKVLGYYGFPVVTIGFALTALIKSNPLERFRWIVGIVALAALTALSVWQLRGTAAASMVAAPILAASLTILWPARAAGRSLIFLAVAASSASFAAFGLSTRALVEFIAPKMAIADIKESKCQTVSDAAPMIELPKGRVMAPIDLGPAILLETDHAVFAAPYHRNNDGNAAMLKLMLAPLPTARQMLAERGVDYVVTCSAAPDLDLVRLAPDGLAARLGRGETPEFLEPLDLKPVRDISVWRVRR